jgi:hypothetical protein
VEILIFSSNSFSNASWSFMFGNIVFAEICCSFYIMLRRDLFITPISWNLYFAKDDLLVLIIDVLGYDCWLSESSGIGLERINYKYKDVIWMLQLL